MGTHAMVLSRAFASPSALTHSNPPALSLSRNLQRRKSMGRTPLPSPMAPAASHLTRAVTTLQTLNAFAGAGGGARTGARAGVGARAVVGGLGLETAHGTPFSLLRPSSRRRAPLASSLSRPRLESRTTPGAPWLLSPRQYHPIGARAGLQSAFILAEGDGEGEEEGGGQKQGQGVGIEAETQRDPWLTSTDESSPSRTQHPSPGANSHGVAGSGYQEGSSLQGEPGGGPRGALSSLPTSELKRLLDMGGVGYRDCLEKEDLVRRLEGMRDFIPRAAQQELARVLEGASGVKGSGAGQGPRGIAGDASPGPSGGAPPQRPPPAPWNRAHPEVQGAGGAEGLWSLPRPGFREEAWWLDAERNSIRRFQECGPSVVHIAALAPVRQGARASPLPSPSPSPLDMNPEQIPRGTGSGFIWDKQGHIVTNFHVVMNGSTTRVTLSDASTWDARLVGVAANKDIAVLKIDAPPHALTPLPVGSSEVGQHVLAIGNPFGLDRTLTAGIISGVGRDIRSVGGRMIRGVVQTDASINPGNSGGPLLDSQGRLIGVNTAIFSPSGASAGVGFAIPVDTVRRTVDRIVRDGRATRPALGIIVASLAQAAQVRVSEGVLVLGLQEGPVQRSGLRGTTRDVVGRMVLGDVIVAINGNKVQTVEDLMSIVEDYQPGQTVRVTVQRGSTKTDVYVELMEIDD